ncbi:MAG: hypothetical protein SPI59_04885, partial [Finegoldia sp.]|nr:hypothetical protein [Finegoldia sp.]
MKKKLLVTMLALTLMFSTTACNKNTGENTEQNTQTSEQATTSENKGKAKHDFKDKLQGEDGKVRWVRGHSGNLMMTMARQNGYLEEYGLEVEEIPMQTTK